MPRFREPAGGIGSPGRPWPAVAVLVASAAATALAVSPYPAVPAMALAAATSPPPVITGIDRTVGPISGGVVVNITGTGFLGASATRFGTVAVDSARVSVNSDTAITATSPAQSGAGPVDITVVRGGVASEATAADRFTYTIGRWNATPPMPSSRQRPLTVLLDPPSCRQSPAPAGYPCGKVLVAGGTGPSSGCCTSAVIFDPAPAGSAPSWSPAGSTSLPHAGGSLTLLADGTALVAGGLDAAGNPSGVAELYDPIANTWSPAGSLTPRSNATATALPDGSVLIAGGIDGAGQLRSVESYHPATRQWTTAAPMHAARAGHIAVALAGGRVLVAGGSADLSALSSAEIYTPSSDAWTTNTPPMSTPRAGAAAALLSDHTVLVAGGSGTSYALASAEIYSDTAGAWTPSAPMATARAHPSAIAMASGRVLVTGDDAAGATELFDPATGAWSPTAAMSTPRSGLGAVLLGGDRVLACGGRLGGASDFLASAEIWDPTPTTVVLPRPSVTSLSPSSTVTYSGNAPSIAVTITGTDLFPTTAVTFGGVAAGAITANSDTTLVVSSPMHDAGTVDVIVTTPSADGPSTPSRNARFLYYPPPVPTVSTLAPASGPTFGGTSVIVTGTGFYFPPEAPATPAAVHFGADPAVAVSVQSPTQLTAVTPPNASPGPVFVTVTNGTGTSAASSSRQQFSYFTASAPVVTRLLPDRGPGRGGTTVVITGTGLDLPRGAAVTKAVRFGNLPALSGTADSPTQITAVSPPSPLGSVVTVTVTTPGGTSAEAAHFFYEDQGAWTPTAALDDGRYGHTATLLDPSPCRANPPANGAYPCGTVLVAGGIDGFISVASNLRARDGAQLYDPAPSGGAWRPAGSMSSCAAPSDGCQARAWHTATLLDGPACRASAPIPAYCGRVLIAGGATADGNYTTPTDRAELFDPIRGWMSAPSLHAARGHHTATLLDPPACQDGTAPPGYPCGSVLVAGGDDLSSAELYNPADGPLGSWTSCSSGSPTAACPGSMASPRLYHTATLLRSGDVLVAGGLTQTVGDSRSLLSAELYSPETGGWRAAAPMAQPRFSHSATLLDGPSCATSQPASLCGDVLVAGGVSEADSNGGFARFRDSVELYDPTYRDPRSHSIVGRWSATGRLSQPRAGHAATLLPNGQVLVAGGGMSFEIHRTPYVIVHSPNAELYDPQREAWSATNDMGTDRGLATSTVLDGPPCRAGLHRPGYCGAVLVAAGAGGGPQSCTPSPGGESGNCPETLASAELYTHAPTVTSLSPDSGSRAGGDQVAVGGVGFRTGDVVMFGDQPADAVTVDSPTLITAVTPRHPAAGHVTVAVSDSAGSSVLSPLDWRAEFTYDTCATAGPGQVAYPAGYSVVGLPTGTSVPAQSLLYGWFDQNSGAYTAADPRAATTTGGHGYWAWFSCTRAVTPSATPAASMTEHLDPGHASLVGNPSPTLSAAVSGQDFAAVWDRTLNGGTGGYRISGYRQVETLGVGQGLWVFSYPGADVTLAPG